jgi:hypothetical protein
MARKLKLTAGQKYDRVEVQLFDGAELKAAGAWTFKQPKHYREAAAMFRIDKDKVQAAVMKALQAAVGEPVEVDLDEKPQAGPFTLTLRGLREPASAGRVFPGEPVEAFKAALLVADYPAAEPLLTWTNRGELCAVDADFEAPPDGLEEFIRNVAPRPRFAWVTHGGGLRLIYSAAGPLAADELGAIASLAVLRRFPQARIELKTDTRHPAYDRAGARCGEVLEQIGDRDTSALSALFVLSDCDDDRRNEYLADRGLELGRRYPHDQCPVDPHAPGQRDPVHVCEGGIYCYACAGRGVRFGSRAPGYFPYVGLTGNYIDSALRIAVENFAHWTHFKHVLEESYGLDPEIGECVYRAALKLRHGDDPRAPKTFTAGRDLLRLEQGWATTGGEPLTRNVENILAELPAVQDAEGKPAASRVTFFAQPSVDLAGYGYPSLAPIWGCRIASQFLDVHGFGKVFQTPALRNDAMRELRAQYLPPRSRPFDEETAWGVVEEVFPGVNRDLVRLLIAARGASEMRAAMPPFIFVKGPSQAGKTGTVHLAASICGDAATGVDWQRNSERVRQGVLQAKATGSFVLLNEIMKKGQADRQSIEETLDFLLTLTPDSVSHRLYVGPVRLGWLPVVVLTDTVVPAELKQSRQLARRLIYAPIFGMVEWERTLQQIGSFDRFRIADPRHAAAGNVILSAVVDRFFRVPRTLKDMAAELGYSSLDQSAEAMDGQGALRALFDAVCDAPDARSLPVGMTGRGWKSIEPFHETRLSDLWREIGQRKATECPWSNLLGVPGEVEIEIREGKSGKTYMRFVADRRTKLDYKVNREIVPSAAVELEPGPVENGSIGPRNPIADKLEFGWLETLPSQFFD